MLFLDYYHAYSTGKNMMGSAILHAVPDVYMAGFGMIFSGHITLLITGLLMNFGLTYMIVKGLWKLLASSLTHQIFGFILHTFSGLINVFLRRFSL